MAFDMNEFSPDMSERQMILASLDVEEKYREMLEQYVLQRMEMIATTAYGESVDFAPNFYSFAKNFETSKNKTLADLSQKALKKIEPFLKKYDEENGLDKLPETEQILDNFKVLEKYDSFDPFENDNGEWIYPQFQKTCRILQKIEITDDNDKVDAQATKDFWESFVETTKLKTYTYLMTSAEHITLQTYCDRLQFEMDTGLIMIFTADIAAKNADLKRETPEKIKQDIDELFQKLEAE
ncbi:MAG: hypothetical protein MJ250_02915 [Alphaproteobacteria bacterium]|nr:hypothetical protein [Alphaproteobacteria bacterium]